MATAPQPLSSETPGFQQRRRFILLLMLGWSLFVVLAVWWLHRETGQPGGGSAWVYHAGESNQQPIAERLRDWFRLAHLNFQRIYPWVLLGPYIALLASYFPLERGRLRKSVPIHLLGCVAFAAASSFITAHSNMTIARVVIYNSNRHFDGASDHVTNTVRVELSKPGAGSVIEETTVNRSGRIHPKDVLPDILTLGHPNFSNSDVTNLLRKVEQAIKPPMTPPELPTMRPLTTLLDLLAYGAIAGLAHSVHFYRRYREREHQALQLESNLAKARLGALQAQLQPHFLFNSLNAIVTLVRRDPPAAEATLTALSDLLRLTLSQSEKQKVSLREELHFVQRYLEIQLTRFGDRLRFEQDVAPATLDCLVPTLLLQPLVENAILHGIEPSEHQGLVRLSVYKENGHLVLTLEDNGAGLVAANAAFPYEPEPRVSATIMTLPDPVNAAGKPPGRSYAAPANSQRTGIGLANLRARFETLYGKNQKLECSSPPQGGFVVRIEIPFQLTDAEPRLDHNGTQ